MLGLHAVLQHAQTTL